MKPKHLKAGLLFILFGCLASIGVLGFLMRNAVGTMSTGCVGQGNASKPILRMELVRNANDVECLLGKPETDAGKARRKDMADVQILDFWFIGVYTLLFIAAAVANAGFPAVEPRWLRMMVGMTALVILLAGAADCMEDIAILNVLKSPVDASRVSWWALSKWRLIAGAVILEGVILIFCKRCTVIQLWFFSFLGSFGVFAAALCLWATFTQLDSVLESHIDLCFFGFALIVICAIVEPARILTTNLRKLKTP